MLVQDTAKNVGGVFFMRHSVYGSKKGCRWSRRMESYNHKRTAI